jgi:hypothetical protein
VTCGVTTSPRSDHQASLTCGASRRIPADLRGIRQRLAADLVILQQQVDSPAMWDVAAKLMTLYAKTFPGSDGAKASGWYRIAAVAADRSGDRSSRVWVRGRAAIALGYEGASLPGLLQRDPAWRVNLSRKPVP